MLDGTHHTGITVSNLDRWLAFLDEGLGLIAASTFWSDSPEVAAAVGLKQARARIAFVQLPDASHIELIEYVEPPGRAFDLSSNDVGALHVCLRVSDIRGMMHRLEGAGATFWAEPVTIKGGDLDGWQFVYFREPIDGVVLELIQPAG